MPTLMKVNFFPEWCLLSEAFLWAALLRLPPLERNIIYPHRGASYNARSTDWTGFDLTTDESERLAIPPDPGAARWQCATDPYYWETDLALGKITAKEAESAALKAAEIAKARTYWWDEHLTHALSRYKASFFLHLLEGRLPATGLAVPLRTVAEAESALRDKTLMLTDDDRRTIPAEFWRDDGIAWDDSRAISHTGHYCHIHVDLGQLFRLYPAPTDDLVTQANVFRLGGGGWFLEFEGPLQTPTAKGRRPLPWEEFHLKVTEMLLQNELPDKKEAGIALLMQWFQLELKLEVSRSAIGGKLKPYYDRFKAGGQKSD